MIQLDTVKLLIPSEFCSSFRYYKQHDNNQGHKGIISLVPERFTGGALIEINSNLFHEPQLISKNNIDEALGLISDSGLIQLYPEAATAVLVTTLDATKDVYMSDNEIYRCLKLVKALCCSTTFHKRTYQRNDNITFYYANSVRGKYATELKMYHKEDRLRTEIRFKNTKSIQFQFDVHAHDNFGRVRLLDVLNSSRNVVANVYDKVTTNMHNQNMDIREDLLFLNQLKGKEFDLFSTLERFNFDLDSIYQARKPSEPKTKSKAKIIAPYVPILQRWNLFDAKLAPDAGLLQKLRQSLDNQSETITQQHYNYAA